MEAFSLAVQLAVAEWLRQVHPTALDGARIEEAVERAIAGWISTAAGRRFLSDAIRSGVEQTAQTWLCQNSDAILRAIGEGKGPAGRGDVQ
jgi:succinate dehydrogenase/fumarate reductase flavoprotein subunit